MSRDRRRERHERLALTHLNYAFQKADGTLAPEWVEEDSALQTLHGVSGWALVMERYDRSRHGNRDGFRVDETSLLESRRTEVRGYPARPWGNPGGRAVRWIVVAVPALVGAFVLPIVATRAPAAAAGLIAVFSLWRAWLAHREARRTRASERR